MMMSEANKYMMVREHLITEETKVLNTLLQLHVSLSLLSILLKLHDIKSRILTISGASKSSVSFSASALFRG
jgi:hypothetical protein